MTECRCFEVLKGEILKRRFMQSLLQFFPKRGEDGKMATVPKGRLRKFTSARTRDILRKSVKVAVLTLLVVLCYRWNQRRRFALDAVARDERMLNAERQVEGLRVLEVSRIEDEDPMSVYDQIMDPLPREGIRTGDAVKADEARAAPNPGEAPVSEKRPDGEGADEKSDKNEITDTEKKEESDNLWDAAEKETGKETKEKKEESDDVAAAKDPNPPEENKVPNAISETVEEEPEKKTASAAEEIDNTKNTESLSLEPPRPASPASNGLGAFEKAPSETREAPNEPANESLAVDGIEGTIGKLKDAIGGIKMKLEEMRPSSKMYNRGYENQPQAPAVVGPGSPSTARELERPKRDPADGDSAGRFAREEDDLIFGRREAGKERRQR